MEVASVYVRAGRDHQIIDHKLDLPRFTFSEPHTIKYLLLT